MINVLRNLPAPASLAPNKPYRHITVLKALNTVFNGKCYLTEKVFDSINEIEIDHFIPQNERPDLICEWTNLYACDHKANNSRPKTTPLGGYLDPCNPDDDVEYEIVYTVEFGGKVEFAARHSHNSKAVNTAKLLNHLHKGLKRAIEKKYYEIIHAIAEWRTAKDIGDVQEELDKRLLLKNLLSRDSHYTMLMRSIRVVRFLPEDFFD
jgi:hypothetical protein